jgi:hypothetical protein
MLNDVMDGLGFMEGLINSVKPLYFEVTSIKAKAWIPCQKSNYQPIADLLRIHLLFEITGIKRMAQKFLSLKSAELEDTTGFRTAKKPVIHR